MVVAIPRSGVAADPAIILSTVSSAQGTPTLALMRSITSPAVRPAPRAREALRAAPPTAKQRRAAREASVDHSWAAILSRKAAPPSVFELLFPLLRVPILANLTRRDSTQSSSYGWLLTAVASLAVSVSFGPVIVFTFGVFLLPLTEEFGWSRGEISIAFSVAALTVSLTSPLIGRLTDRLGPRPVILTCATVYAAAYASLSKLTGSLAHLYGVYFVIGLVGNGATQLPYSRAVAEWFDRRRGIALSVMMTGVGAGIVVMPPLAQYLIDLRGWRNTYLVLGAIMFCVAVPLPAVFLRRGPAAQASSIEDSPADGMTAKQALRTGPFWIIAACFFLQSISLNGCVAHLAPLLSDRGLSGQQAAVAASVLGGFTMAGRLATGWLLDRFFAPRVTASFFAAAVAGTLVLLLPVTETTALSSAALIGLSMGAEADAMPYLISRYFGLRSFTELFGYVFAVYAVAGALGPALMGLGYDRFGDYRLTIAALAVAISTSTLLMLRLPQFQKPATALQTAAAEQAI